MIYYNAIQLVNPKHIPVVKLLHSYKYKYQCIMTCSKFFKAQNNSSSDKFFCKIKTNIEINSS